MSKVKGNLKNMKEAWGGAQGLKAFSQLKDSESNLLQLKLHFLTHIYGFVQCLNFFKCLSLLFYTGLPHFFLHTYKYFFI